VDGGPERWAVTSMFGAWMSPLSTHARTPWRRASKARLPMECPKAPHSGPAGAHERHGVWGWMREAEVDVGPEASRR